MPNEWETIYQTRLRSECMELRLVLSATGIHAEARHDEGWWLLLVRKQDSRRSMIELDCYRVENSHATNDVSQPRIGYPGSGIAVAAYGLCMVTIAAWDYSAAFGIDWQSVGAMEAGKVLAGQAWRCLTALTLHVDLGHLMSNLVFGTLFGLIAGRIYGGGAAWLAIVLGGGLGNLANACLREPTHWSIGSSTAVFSALGLIVYDAIHSGWSERETIIRRWSPLVGGLVLFAFTGLGSERTDVVAHATGLGAGLMLGWIMSNAKPQWLSQKKHQFIAGSLSIAIIALAWLIGIVKTTA